MTAPRPAANAKTIHVLDYGYVRLVETWGKGDAGEPEAAIIEAARQSTQGAFRGWESDEKLLGFLHRMGHSTPFEFCGMTIEVQAPILVFREWHRHRTQSYSEMSARYAPLPDLNYIPTLDRVMLGAKETPNKQAGAVKGAEPLDEAGANWFRDRLMSSYIEAQDDYQSALNLGVPKELARCFLPVGRYSRMRAQAVLRNWLGFLTLRMAPDAQYEIRQYANAVGQLIAREFPRTWALFTEARTPSG